MRGANRAVLAACAAVVLLVPMTPYAPPAEAALTKRVSTPSVTLRAGPGSWAIGAAFGYGSSRTPWTVDVQQNPVNTFRWGFVGGSFQYCAWISEQAMPPGGESGENLCSMTNRVLPPSHFMSAMGSNYPPAKGNDGAFARINHRAVDCNGQIQAYANVRPWQVPAEPHDYLFNTPDALAVRWRYVTRDGQWVMIRDPRHTIGQYPPNWYFVRRQCIDLKGPLLPPPA